MYRESRIVGGCHVYYLQHGMLILPWLMEGKSIECKKKSDELGAPISKLRLGEESVNRGLHSDGRGRYD